MTLHDLNNIAGGDPGLIRAEATRLGVVCAEVAVVADRLRAVSTHGVWDSGAGETFAAHVGEVPVRLDAVRVRLESAAGLLPPYATLLEDAQERLRHLDDQHAQAQRIVTERDRELATLPPDAPERASLMAERGEAAAQSFRIQQTFMRVSDEILADEKRLAARLSDVGSGLADPQGYDVFEGLSAFGSGSIVNNPVTALVRPLKLAGFAHPLGELGRLLVYDEGSWADVGTAAKTALFGIVKLPKGAGATADEVVRHRKLGAGVMAAKARHARPVGTSGSGLKRLRHTAGTKVRQTTAAASVRAGYAAKEGLAKVSGTRFIDNMRADWAATAGAGRVTKGGHVLKYSVAAVDKADSTMRSTQKAVDIYTPGSRTHGESRSRS